MTFVIKKFIDTFSLKNGRSVANRDNDTFLEWHQITVSGNFCSVVWPKRKIGTVVVEVFSESERQLSFSRWGFRLIMIMWPVFCGGGDKTRSLTSNAQWVFQVFRT